MRWVWPYPRHVRININRQHLLPSTCAWLEPPSGADPKLQNPCRRYLAIEKWPRSRFSGLQNLSPRPPLHLLEAGHDKHPLKAPEYPQANEYLDDRKDADALEQRDDPEPTKAGRGMQTTRDADIAQFTKETEFVKDTEPALAPLDLTRFASRRKVVDYPNVSESEIIAKDPAIQPVRHTVASNRNKQRDEPLSTSSTNLTGVIIDGQGQLQIESTAEALKERPTALVVSSVSGNMLESDFIRLLAHAPDHEKRPVGSMRGKLDYVTL